MDLQQVVNDLDNEIERLTQVRDAARAALDSGNTSAPVKRSRLSAAARKRLSESMKRRWREGRMGKRKK